MYVCMFVCLYNMYVYDIWWYKNADRVLMSVRRAFIREQMRPTLESLNPNPIRQTNGINTDTLAEFHISTV